MPNYGVNKKLFLLVLIVSHKPQFSMYIFNIYTTFICLMTFAYMVTLLLSTQVSMWYEHYNQDKER